MKNLIIILTIVMIALLLSCEKQTESLHPLVGWWRVHDHETTYFADLPKIAENIDSVKFVDCMEDFIHLYFDENGTGIWKKSTISSNGVLEYGFTWTVTEDNLSMIKDNNEGELNYKFQIIEDLFHYTNEGVLPAGYWTCINTAIRGK